MTRYTDNARVPVGKLTGRVICAANRTPQARAAMAAPATAAAAEPAEAVPVAEGQDAHGRFLRFEVRDGDVSANDAAKGKGAPKRAFITVEQLGNVPRSGARITQHFGLVVEPGPILVRNLFCVLAQENVYPNDGKSWRSPPVELGVVNVDRMEASGRIARTGAGRPIQEERLCLKTHALDASGKQVVSGMIMSREPLERGRFYREIAIAFVDGQGGPGRAELWINGRQQGTTLLVPTGYPDCRSPYPAFGVYAHVGQVPVAARFYGWRESGTV